MREPEDFHVRFLNAQPIRVPLDYPDTLFKLVPWVETSP